MPLFVLLSEPCNKKSQNNYIIADIDPIKTVKLV